LGISCRRKVSSPRYKDFACEAHGVTSAGIDLTQPPSKMVLMKLAMDGEFRTAITKVMTELKQAGIDVTPEVSLIFSRCIVTGR
jgi:hypothetical protein